MPTILSTKKLTTSQKQLLLNSGLGLIEYDAIKINLTEASLPAIKFKNLIFTSQNAVKAVLKNQILLRPSDYTIFCIGEKTAGLLEASGYKFKICAENGAALAQIIIQKFNQLSYTYFCGNKRRDELPETLLQHGIEFEEVKVYNTNLNEKKFGRQFDAVLFFSPSGVKSFCAKNELKGITAICIGKTTAAEAKKYTDLIRTANKATIENVIVQAVKILGKAAKGKR